ncbi:MAG: sigma-70 family RNA polymerase sigma factor [Aureispira sp.]|nr:sigma-70 family RNA polymerase sigma factor [Aureispira sp.]
MHQSSAMGLLYDRYSAIIYGIILRIVKSKPIAEDVLQDTMMKIWHNINTYSPNRGRFVSWMLRIARNKAIDTIRSAKYQQQKNNLDIEGQIALPQKTQFNPDTIGIKEMVDKLPFEYRQVVEMAYFKGFTQSEMAKELELPLGTIKTRIRIGLRELRKLVKE